MTWKCQIFIYMFGITPIFIHILYLVSTQYSSYTLTGSRLDLSTIYGGSSVVEDVGVRHTMCYENVVSTYKVVILSRFRFRVTPLYLQNIFQIAPLLSIKYFGEKLYGQEF